MFCANCRASRPENMAPCPTCGAASPLAVKAQVDGVGGWGNAETAWSAWSTSGSQGTQQWGQSLSSPRADGWGVSSAAQPSQVQPNSWFQQQSAFQSNQLPDQAFPAAAPASASDQRQALLPVPYQGGQNMQQGLIPMGTMLQVMSSQSIEQMLPAIPEEVDTVYVPPMYTKPRAIIPKYRAISGLVSFIIVTLLLCSGATYYAQASGKLDPLKRLLTGAPPPSLPAQNVNIPDPRNDIVKGPAYLIIPSAATTLTIDPTTKIARQPQKIFQVGQEFYVTDSVHPQGKPGVVTIKFYTGNDLYSTQSQALQDGADKNGFVRMKYVVAASGSVEFYWNGQLAQKIFFAVR